MMCVRICTSYVLYASVDLKCRERGNLRNVLGRWEVKKTVPLPNPVRLKLPSTFSTLAFNLRIKSQG